MLFFRTFSVQVLKGGQGATVAESWHALAVERHGVKEVEFSALLALLLYPTIRHREGLKPFMHLLPFEPLKFKVCICKIAFFVRFEQHWAQICPTPATFWVSVTEFVISRRPPPMFSEWNLSFTVSQSYFSWKHWTKISECILLWVHISKCIWLVNQQTTSTSCSQSNFCF